MSSRRANKVLMTTPKETIPEMKDFRVLNWSWTQLVGSARTT